MRHVSIFLFGILVSISCPLDAVCQLEFEREPINYSKTKESNDVTKLLDGLQSGDVKLKHDPEHGYLKSLLDHFKIPASSQTLVFSKTSFQRHRISPRTPRALYFNDDIYVGWVQNGDMIEISTADTKLGAVFYSLKQDRHGPPKIKRDDDKCMICHSSTHTNRIPGHIMRSVFTEASGMPNYSLGTKRTSHKSPLEERWGGWYVTGLHGQQRHKGNVTLNKGADSNSRESEWLNIDAGANRKSHAKDFDSSPYLSEGSDIVALMVLAHQVSVHNAITAAGFSARRAIHDGEVMNKALDRPAGFQSDSTKRRFASAADKLVEWLLMSDEAELSDPITGSSSFATDFQRRGPFDDSGRSLRQLSLGAKPAGSQSKGRLFRYPCSYLIYSRDFAALPDRFRSVVYQRLWNVLTGKDDSKPFGHLSATDRKNILAILRNTKSNLPDYWMR